MNEAEDLTGKWCKRVRQLRPERCKDIGDEVLTSIIAAWIDLLQPLQVANPEDQSRFVQLAVLLTPEQKRSPLINGAVQRILSYTDWDPKIRLDFVYKHVIGRPVSVAEEDFGPAFPSPEL